MRKKWLAFPLVFMFLLSGCTDLPIKTPLEEVQAILVAGIDKKGDQVELTVMSVGSKPGSESNGGGEIIKVYESTGRTVFEAKQKMSLFNDKHLIWAHLEYIVIGDEIARSGIAKYMDFFIRNHENRITDELIIAKDMTAKEFIKKTDSSEPKMNEKIRRLFSETEVESVMKVVNLKEWALKYQSDTMSIILPAMGITDQAHTENTEEEKGDPKIDIRSAGYAIFDREGKLIDYASLRFSRGINWVIDEVQSSVVVIAAEDKALLSTEIVSSKTKLEINEEASELKVNIQVIFNIPEYTGVENLYDIRYIGKVKEELENIIRDEVIDSMTYLQGMDADVTNIGDLYYHKYPKSWDYMKDQWESKFKEMNINVVVKSTIRNTYNIINPMRRG